MLKGFCFETVLIAFDYFTKKHLIKKINKKKKKNKDSFKTQSI